MALVCVKLTKSALDHTHLDVKEAILQYNPSQEKTTRKIVQVTTHRKRKAKENRNRKEESRSRR